MPPDDPQPESYNPLALIAVVLGALLLFAVFFFAFLIAPLAILTIFYVGFAASDRSKQRRGASSDRVVEELPPVVVTETPHLDDGVHLTAAERLAIEQAQRRAGTHG